MSKITAITIVIEHYALDSGTGAIIHHPLWQVLGQCAQFYHTTIEKYFCVYFERKQTEVLVNIVFGLFSKNVSLRYFLKVLCILRTFTVSWNIQIN